MTFIKKDRGFECINCHSAVSPLDYSSRDHCNVCLYGQHVDIDPGDRLNECKGILVPIGIKLSNQKQQVVYKCQKCSKVVFCLASKDDDTNKLVELSGKVWYE